MHRIEQLAAGEDAPRLPGERGEDPELGRRERDDPARNDDPMPGRIDLQVPDDEAVSGSRGRLRPAEDRTNARHEPWANGFTT